VNDTGSRVADLTIRDDYDPVEGVEPVKVDFGSTASPSTPALLQAERLHRRGSSESGQAQRKAVEAGMHKGKSQEQAGEGSADSRPDGRTCLRR
jgi:hypothetical protein